MAAWRLAYFPAQPLLKVDQKPEITIFDSVIPPSLVKIAFHPLSPLLT
jgi:hypothetical protein